MSELPHNRDEWPEAVATLVAEGDPAAIGALVRAYDRPGEGGRSKLLDALDSLGAVAEAQSLATGDVADRHTAARLMHLLPDPIHLESLVRLVLDDDADVAAAARRAMRGQRRTPEWHAAVERLATGGDAVTADAARQWLAESGRTS